MTKKVLILKGSPREKGNSATLAERVAAGAREAGAQFSGRFMVAARSPLTGAWGDANCGGNFGPALRGAGYDGLFISGQAEKPVYLYVDGGKIEIRDASHLWGLDARQTEEALRKETASDARAACIGPAGEKLSLISGIVNDDGRLAARCGRGKGRLAGREGGNYLLRRFVL